MTRTQEGQLPPNWLVEISNGVSSAATSYTRFCTRGYAFKIHKDGRKKETSDYGVSATGGDVIYYGILNEILEIRYPGILDLRCTVFMCDWYDPIFGRGVRIDNLGVISVNTRRKLGKYDPFILASQADQVSYIPYPRVTYRSDPWVTVTKILPRGRIHGVPENAPLQPSRSLQIDDVNNLDDVELVVDVTDVGDIRSLTESEESLDEFEEDSDSLSSEGPTDISE